MTSNTREYAAIGLMAIIVVGVSISSPQSKGTRNPLDTILGFNDPPASDANGNSGDEPTNDTGVSQRTRHDDLCPEGQLWDINTARCLPECDPIQSGQAPGINCTLETGEPIEPKEPETPTSRDIPGPPVMSPLTGENSANDVPLLTDDGTQSPTSTEPAGLASPDLPTCPEGQHWDEHLQICVPDVETPDLPGPHTGSELDKDIEAEDSPGQSSPTEGVAEQSPDEADQEFDSNNSDDSDGNS